MQRYYNVIILIGDMVIWAHPFDLHFGSDSIFGWPRLKLHVWRLDNYGKIDNGNSCFCLMHSLISG